MNQSGVGQGNSDLVRVLMWFVHQWPLSTIFFGSLMCSISMWAWFGGTADASAVSTVVVDGRGMYAVGSAIAGLSTLSVGAWQVSRLGLTEAIERGERRHRVWRFRRDWPGLVHRLEWQRSLSGSQRSPKLVSVDFRSGEILVEAKMLPAQSMNNWPKMADALRRELSAARVSIRESSPGVLQMRLMYEPPALEVSDGNSVGNAVRRVQLRRRQPWAVPEELRETVTMEDDSPPDR